MRRNKRRKLWPPTWPDNDGMQHIPEHQRVRFRELARSMVDNPALVSLWNPASPYVTEDLWTAMRYLAARVRQLEQNLPADHTPLPRPDHA